MTGRVDPSKAERALELHEKGLSHSLIAERLGVYKQNVGGMIEKARKRREKRKTAK